MKKEDYGMSVHFTGIVYDSDGSGRDLIQYSQFWLKEDVLNWLKQNHRLPSTTMSEHFEDIQELNKLSLENTQQTSLIERQKEENESQTEKINI